MEAGSSDGGRVFRPGVPRTRPGIASVALVAVFEPDLPGLKIWSPFEHLICAKSNRTRNIRRWVNHR